MPKEYGEKVTDEDKKVWGGTSLMRRAEMDGLVYEYKENGKMYVLDPHGAAPRRAGETRSLYLIGVINFPEVHFLARFNEKAEDFSKQ